jgi:hypothetical protein
VAGGLLGVLVSMLNNGQAGLAIAAALLFSALVLLVARRRHRVVAGRTARGAWGNGPRGGLGGRAVPPSSGGSPGGRPPGASTA